MCELQEAANIQYTAPPKRWDNISSNVRLALLLVVMVSPMVIAIPSLWGASQSIFYQEFRAPRLQRELGFTLTGLVLDLEDEYRETPVITPCADGFMARAGFKQNDVIVSHSTLSFYRMLHIRRGKLVIVDVVQTDLESPVRRNASRSIIFTLPA